MSSGPQESSAEQRRLQRRELNISYQIFPEPSEPLEPLEQLEPGRVRERLPSIVVEPSEESEEEGTGARWTLLHTHTSVDEEEEEEDLFQEHCEPHGSGQEEQSAEDGVPRFKRSSIPGIQIDYSRLTPPPSPTSSHAAPPRFRS